MKPENLPEKTYYTNYQFGMKPIFFKAMKTFLFTIIFLLGIGFADAKDRIRKKHTYSYSQEKTHKKHSNISKNKIVYSEKKHKPSFTRKKPTKKHMFAGENMHRDRFK